MSEWWTYSLTNFLLFSPRTYYRLFELTNADVWPLQILTLALGVVMAFLMLRPRPWSGRVIAAALAALWLFVAWAYLLERYETINWAARYVAIAFVLQAALLTWTGVIRDRLRFETSVPQTPAIPAQAGIQSPKRELSIFKNWVPAFAGTSGARLIGLALSSYALVIHPLIAPLTGRPITQAEIFGLAPDPTAIATLGILLAADRPSLHLFVVPFLWCLVTGLTLWTMESPEAPVAPLLALLALALVIPKTLAARRKMR
jgi:hypothetical protein